MICSLLTATSVFPLHWALLCTKWHLFTDFPENTHWWQNFSECRNLALGSLGKGHRQGIILAYMALGLLPLFLMLGDLPQATTRPRESPYPSLRITQKKCNQFPYHHHTQDGFCLQKQPPCSFWSDLPSVLMFWLIKCSRCQQNEVNAKVFPKSFN